ncbi:endonuclease [Alteromonas sp. ASW11-36]|uniref:Endonuclease n=1 Tax=Alteromonas arenosi TaxID=3055817 RepID=A0ABT7SUL9_9ALTE|nr:endonuclease [Alteromonas sp. ASW11-36]MDM7859247.1 endonuclease [Alteromonas sp. ASW11-36]
MQYKPYKHRWLMLPTIFLCSSVFAAPPPGYYDTVDQTNATTLRSSLHEIIDDHQRFPYTSSSTDTWDILEAADEDPDNPNNVITIYKNETYAKVGGGNSFYNREHSWPKSYGFPSDGSSNYPYTDAHHLFIADSGYNSSRSNKPYAECDVACIEKITILNNGRGGSNADSNFTAGSFSDGSWETWDARKGDVARAMMYMAVRYEGGTHNVTGVQEPDLILTDDRTLIAASNTGANIDVAYMGLLSVLINWHNNDPVDDFERRHNEAVFSHQGNRNPFIDHPEFASCIFENICSGGGGDTTPPNAPTNLAAVSNDSTIALGWDSNIEPDLAGYHVYRSTVAGSGYSRINAGIITTTSYTDTNVSPDTTYFYVVSAIDSSNNQSAFSNEVSGIISGGGTPSEAAAWINEIHYDNDGTDTGEFIEIAGTQGTVLDGYSIVAYNGNGGTAYKTIALSGTLANQANGMGTLSFAASGLQNGSPDGLALIDNAGNVIQFISYEGSLIATDGPAAGLQSTDIGVSETSSTPVGYSLQLSGAGSRYSEFYWVAPSQSSPGQINSGQSFIGGPVNEAPVAAFISACDALTCTFDASQSSDSDGAIVSYAWTFGDGSIASVMAPSHSYATSGSYTVTLTVTDDQGASDTASADVIVVAPVVITPWINEFHYDNKGGDKNEFVEIAGQAGTDLNGWSLVAYNGGNGQLYQTVNLSGTIANQQNGYGTQAFNFAGLQNGGPDGLALVDDTGVVVMFISYEGTFTATNGPAAGLTSDDIGVAEDSSTRRNYSLQLIGFGQQYSDFVWQTPRQNTKNAVNQNQSF